MKDLRNTLADQANEISSIRNEISSMKNEISSMKGPTSLWPGRQNLLNEEWISSLKAHLNESLKQNLIWQQSITPTYCWPNTDTIKSQPQFSSTQTSDGDRKFSIIPFRISESYQGTLRFRRSENDFRDVYSAVSNLEDDSDHKNLVCDCHLIGKYNSSNHWPTQVILGSTADVSHILSLQSSLSSLLAINPDFSPSETKVEKLLSERWTFIWSGTDYCSQNLIIPVSILMFIFVEK